MRNSIDRDKLTSPAPTQPRTGAALSLPWDSAQRESVLTQTCTNSRNTSIPTGVSSFQS